MMQINPSSSRDNNSDRKTLRCRTISSSSGASQFLAQLHSGDGTAEMVIATLLTHNASPPAVFIRHIMTLGNADTISGANEAAVLAQSNSSVFNDVQLYCISWQGLVAVMPWGRAQGAKKSAFIVQLNNHKERMGHFGVLYSRTDSGIMVQHHENSIEAARKIAAAVGKPDRVAAVAADLDSDDESIAEMSKEQLEKEREQKASAANASASSNGQIVTIARTRSFTQEEIKQAKFLNGHASASAPSASAAATTAATTAAATSDSTASNCVGGDSLAAAAEEEWEENSIIEHKYDSPPPIVQQQQQGSIHECYSEENAVLLKDDNSYRYLIGCHKCMQTLTGETLARFMEQFNEFYGDKEIRTKPMLTERVMRRIKRRIDDTIGTHTHSVKFEFVMQHNGARAEVFKEEFMEEPANRHWYKCKTAY